MICDMDGVPANLHTQRRARSQISDGSITNRSSTWRDLRRDARRTNRPDRVVFKPEALPVEEYVAGLACKRMAAGVLFRDNAGRVLLVEPSRV